MENLKSVTEHQIYFREFISEIVSKFSPLQIISFAKKSCIGHNDGCFLIEYAKSSFNYCLLLVTETSTRIDYEAQDFCNTRYTQGSVTLIAHDSETITKAISKNSYFFSSILYSGDLLYSYDGLPCKRDINPFNYTNREEKAKKHFNHRLPLAEGFLSAAKTCFADGQFGICLFMCHQAVEQACICLIRVHIAYRSEFHNLYRLLCLCTSFSDLPFETLLSSTEDERLFSILSKSYSAARYREDFNVCYADAEKLLLKINTFIELAKKMCSEKIQELSSKEMSFTIEGE